MPASEEAEVSVALQTRISLAIWLPDLGASLVAMAADWHLGGRGECDGYDDMTRDPMGRAEGMPAQRAIRCFLLSLNIPRTLKAARCCCHPTSYRSTDAMKRYCGETRSSWKLGTVVVLGGTKHDTIQA